MVRYRLAACIVACCAVVVTTAAARSLRLQVAPGASLAFGPGWVARANSDGRYRLAGMPRSDCRSGGNEILLRYMVSGQPVDLQILHVDDVSASETEMRAATPEFVATTSERLCA